MCDLTLLSASEFTEAATECRMNNNYKAVVVFDKDETKNDVLNHLTKYIKKEPLPDVAGVLKQPSELGKSGIVFVNNNILELCTVEEVDNLFGYDKVLITEDCDFVNHDLTSFLNSFVIKE